MSLMNRINEAKAKAKAKIQVTGAATSTPTAAPLKPAVSTPTGQSALAALQAAASGETKSTKPTIQPTTQTTIQVTKPLLMVQPKGKMPTLQVKPTFTPPPELTINATTDDVTIPQEGEASTVIPPNNMSVIQQQLTMIAAALEATPMGDVAGHMNVLQAELQGTEYLVDMLEPEDLGLMVLAQRKLMETDILAKTKPKSRSKKVAIPKVTMEELDAVSAGDFAV